MRVLAEQSASKGCWQRAVSAAAVSCCNGLVVASGQVCNRCGFRIHDAGGQSRAASHHRRGVSQGLSSDALGLRFGLPTCALLQPPAKFPPCPCLPQVLPSKPLLFRPTPQLVPDTRTLYNRFPAHHHLHLHHFAASYPRTNSSGRPTTVILPTTSRTS
ncbi:hypothetical protein BKA63DRAFT_275200 [Paraphoma chrysanthemicola]|nr:hypothetical protein BKA63DRAFT_275200 [Paraphoma chrysanthemicola]